MKIYILIVFLLINFFSFSQEIEMSGSIIDTETNKPIKFANIGVLNKNKGTVSNQKGNFYLKFSSKFLKDSLMISHVNYKTIKIPIKNSKNQVVLLESKTNKLSEVVITNKKRRTRKIGVKSYNPLLWLRATSTGNDIIENAQRINISKGKEVKVKYVNAYLRRGFEVDSCSIRINFYKNIDNTPGEKIIFKNIVQNKKIEPGWLQIDITKYDIYLEEDFFIGIEFIPNFKNPFEVYLGAILTKGKGYNRNSSQGSWNKLQGASSINVEVEF